MLDKLGVDRFISLESSVEFHGYMAGRVRDPRASVVFVDVNGPTKTQADHGESYSTWPLYRNERHDLIYIDGRKRNECALTSALVCHPETAVILHDYRRTRYNAMRALFEVIEEGSQFRVMRLRREMHEALAGGAAIVRQQIAWAVSENARLTR